MTDRKYVILSDGTNEYVIIFDRMLSHVDVAVGVAGESSVSKWSKILNRLRPVSAGFCSPSGDVAMGIGSESLKLSPRPQDAALLKAAPAPQPGGK